MLSIHLHTSTFELFNRFSRNLVRILFSWIKYDPCTFSFPTAGCKNITDAQICVTGMTLAPLNPMS